MLLLYEKEEENKQWFVYQPLFLGLKYKVEFVKLSLINTVMNKQISHLNMYSLKDRVPEKIGRLYWRIIYPCTGSPVYFIEGFLRIGRLEGLVDFIEQLVDFIEEPIYFIECTGVLNRRWDK